MSTYNHMMRHQQFQHARDLYTGTMQVINKLFNDVESVQELCDMPSRLVDMLKCVVLYDNTLLEKANSVVDKEYSDNKNSMQSLTTVFECIVHSINIQLSCIRAIIRIGDAFALKFSATDDVQPAGEGWQQLEDALNKLVSTSSDALNNITDFKYMRDIGELSTILKDCDMCNDIIRVYTTSFIDDMHALTDNINKLHARKMHAMLRSRLYRDNLALPLIEYIRTKYDWRELYRESTVVFNEAALYIVYKHRHGLLQHLGQDIYKVSDDVDEYVCNMLKRIQTPQHAIDRLIVAAFDIIEANMPKGISKTRREAYDAALVDVYDKLESMLDAMYADVDDVVPSSNADVRVLKSRYSTEIRHALCTPLLRKYIKHEFNTQEFDAYTAHKIFTGDVTKSVIMSLNNIITHITTTSINTIKLHTAAHCATTIEDSIKDLADNIKKYVNRYKELS